MASFNRVFLLGNLGQDPTIRSTGAGQTVASFSLATSEKTKGKDGTLINKVEWHSIVLWGKQAEIAGEYLKKGKEIFVEGRLQTRKWQDKNGNDKYTTEIVGEKFQMLGTNSAATGNKAAAGTAVADDYPSNSTNTNNSTDSDDVPWDME